MKRTLSILIICFLFVCFVEPSAFIIKAGQEVDGLQLDTAAVQKAIDKYGKYITSTQGVACGVGKGSYYTNRFFFANNIVVLSKTFGSNKKSPVESEIVEIGILYPADAITDKGINLRNDSLDKIIKIYGEPEKKETFLNNIYLHYFSQGISFDCDKHYYTIERIAIYKKGGVPDFYYSKK